MTAEIENRKYQGLIPFSRCGSGTRRNCGIFLSAPWGHLKKKNPQRRRTERSYFCVLEFCCGRCRCCCHTASTPQPFRFHTSTVPLPHLIRSASPSQPFRFRTATIPLPHHSAPAPQTFRFHTSTVPLPHINRSACTPQPLRLRTAIVPLPHRTYQLTP